MAIKEVFFYRDGRTVLAGPIEEGQLALVQPGQAEILIDGKKCATVQIEREVIASRPFPLERLEIRLVATRDPTGLTRDIVESSQCTLEGPMRYAGHRHLVGIDSPPDHYVADDMTLGPRLPDGWDGDAWMKPDDGAFFLRAWNKSTARCAVANGANFEDATKILLDEINSGGRQVEIRITESRGKTPSTAS